MAEVEQHRRFWRSVGELWRAIGGSGDVLIAQRFRLADALERRFGKYRGTDPEVARQAQGRATERALEVRQTQAWKKTLREPTAVELRLAIACETGDFRVVRECLKAGVDPNARDASGSPALKLAVVMGNETSLEICRVLLASGAQADARDACQRTPLMCAVGRSPLKDRNAIVELLLDHGADPSARASASWSCTAPLHLSESCAMNELLIGRGADFRVTIGEGINLLMMWSCKDTPESTGACFSLLEHGIALNDAGPKGKTALQMAVDKDNAFALQGIRAWQTQKAAMAAIAEMSLELGLDDSGHSAPDEVLRWREPSKTMTFSHPR